MLQQLAPLYVDESLEFRIDALLNGARLSRSFKAWRAAPNHFVASDSCETGRTAPLREARCSDVANLCGRSSVGPLSPDRPYVDGTGLSYGRLLSLLFPVRVRVEIHW